MHPVFEEGATSRVSVKSRVFAITSLKSVLASFTGGVVVRCVMLNSPVATLTSRGLEGVG